MLKKSLYFLGFLVFATSQSAFAVEAKETQRYFNGPQITSVDSFSARISLSPILLSGMTDEEKKRVYFEYLETNLVCAAIYPTPEACLPKKTEVGKTQVTLTNLKPETSYTIKYKLDNTIRCITTPCPGNEFESLPTEFTTKKSDTKDIPASPDAAALPVSSPANALPITSSLRFKNHGTQVTTLQTVLIQHGYMAGEPTGYFGAITLKAVKEFQKAHGIIPIGFVGPITRAVFNKMIATSSTTSVNVAELFEGTVTAFSTACFADGECSITVDGKKVVTTIGWSQMIVGKVKGLQDFGSIENNIGAHAKVYAKKTDTGYTLYGSEDYYVEITPSTSSKLTEGSTPSGSSSNLLGTTWVWQKTLVDGINAISPKKSGVFTISFGENGKVSGKTDCNGFFGTYTQGSDGFIKFGPLASTMMYCEDSQESMFTGAVGKVSHYSIDPSGNLVLLSDKDKMFFIKK